MNTAQDYGDIINLPHPEPQAHVRMPLTARAAQFMPFAALKDDHDSEEEDISAIQHSPALLSQNL